MNVKVTFKIKGKIKSETYFIEDNLTKKEAMMKALTYSTGYGYEDYYKHDDPEVLEREIISMEIIED